ncbi:type II glyceraldehyde-3-phosphate dehydrogenase [Methanocella arvoryzae]|uniref:Glyceraldehyde-3-phosphate dehydrogenase n=1 Tax=Methanocella arvoryzae (strain DSM 22066 / NBRC 105507 / MRE50) TaxID=351160 RepID=Q0W6M9_METAR|nr:type II glyceraldehyde-3-phosphate dehydrogenase [Methanocella arvoryzae]CAJ35964.1 glyceraldehyde-3-phosphate dehydrogenase [Methanocella arvoryzae MRE50]
MADKIKVALNGYGTIGKRVADAVMRQDDMTLVGIAKTKPDYEAYVAAKKGYAIYAVDPAKAESKFKAAGLSIAGSNEEMIKKADIIVDCAPEGIGEENKKLYEKLNKPAIFQGGEEHEVAGTSFNAAANYDQAIGKQFVRVVSCNTTGLCRLLYALDKAYGIKKVRATMMRRGGDPNDIKRGPINAIVPDPIHLPSHHGPDVNTVLPHIKIDTVAVKLPTTLMHMHYVNMNLNKTPSREDVIATLKQYPRIWLIPPWLNIKSTADVIEFGRELGRPRNDMMENVIWEESVSVDKEGELNLFQAIHQESDVIPENIDCIRAMTGIEKDGAKSMEKTNKTLGLGSFNPWKLSL